MELTPQEKLQLDFLLHKYRKHPKVCEMKQYMQHGKISTYQHCETVTEKAFMLNKRLGLGADEKALVTGAFLHDFYLYDWHKNDENRHRLHGFFHPQKACNNAKENFDISEQEENIIRSHMWPLTVTRLPMSREAWIVCLVDKYISTRETLFCRRGK